MDGGAIIQLSDPVELSTNFVDCKLAVARDFDGLLVGTVLYNGLPVAYVTHPDSNYGEPTPEHNLPGAQHVLTDDHGQVQCYAHFLHWIGAAGDDFPALVADVLARPSKESGNTLTPWTIWDAFDEADEPSGDDRAVWLDDGHAWCGFINDVENKLYEAYGASGAWPRPNEWYGSDPTDDSAGGNPTQAQVEALLGESM